MRRLLPIAYDLAFSAFVLCFVVGLGLTLGVLSAAKIMDLLWVF